MGISKNHRTIVFVREDAHPERVARLLESLGKPGESPNGTIKVDVAKVTNSGQIVPFDQVIAGGAALSDDDLHAYADENGYDMNLIVS